MESTTRPSDSATAVDEAALDASAAPPDDAPAPSPALEARLRAKEQLVAALTARLEQVAEQLDRVHRSGGDRAVKVGGGLPRELVEQQKTLVEDLQRAIERWEDMQAEATLGRIEMQIGELRDLVANGFAGGQGFAPPHAEGRASGGGSSREASGGPQGYEKLKAELLGRNEPETVDEAAASPTVPYVAPPAEDEEEIDPVEPPTPLDVDAADEDALRLAVQHRDRYIGYLAKRLRVSQSRNRVPTDWEGLVHVPEELRRQFSLLVGTLDENLRLAEVEFSVERARISRLESRLHFQQEQVEKAMKRLGISSEGQSTRPRERDREEPDEDGAAKGGRWFRMLGIRKSEESGDE